MNLRRGALTGFIPFRALRSNIDVSTNGMDKTKRRHDTCARAARWMPDAVVRQSGHVIVADDFQKADAVPAALPLSTH